MTQTPQATTESNQIEFFRLQFFSVYQSLTRIHTSLVISALSFPFLSFPKNIPPLTQYAVTLLASFFLSNGIAYAVDRLHKPRFFNKQRMNVADFINQSLGPNKSYELHAEKSYFARTLAEKEFLSGIISIFVTFLSIPLLLQLSEPLTSRETILTGLFIGQALVVSILYLLSTSFLPIVRYQAEFELKNSGKISLTSILGSSVLSAISLLAFYAAVIFMLLTR